MVNFPTIITIGKVSGALTEAPPTPPATPQISPVKDSNEDPTKATRRKYLESSGFQFSKQNSLKTYILLENGTQREVHIAGPSTALMTRQTYLEHFSHIPLDEQTVIVGNIEDHCYTDYWFVVDFTSHRGGASFAVHRQKFHIVESISINALTCKNKQDDCPELENYSKRGMVIGVNILQNQKAKLIYGVERSGADVLWVDCSFKVHRMFPMPRHKDIDRILEKQGMTISGFTRGRCIRVGSPSSKCLEGMYKS